MMVLWLSSFFIWQPSTAIIIKPFTDAVILLLDVYIYAMNLLKLKQCEGRETTKQLLRSLYQSPKMSVRKVWCGKQFFFWTKKCCYLAALYGVLLKAWNKLIISWILDSHVEFPFLFVSLTWPLAGWPIKEEHSRLEAKNRRCCRSSH